MEETSPRAQEWMGGLMTYRRRAGLLAAVGLMVVIAACGATTTTPTRPPISAANVSATATVKAGGAASGLNGSPGAQLFASQGCIGCHIVKGQGGAVGPNQSTIGTVAATRKPGLDAAGYIRESIVNPNAFVVPGFQPNVMPQTYGQTLTPEQIDQLVNFLLEQK
jgi:mono/diheme cytochrome c family protein